MRDALARAVTTLAASLDEDSVLRLARALALAVVPGPSSITLSEADVARLLASELPFETGAPAPRRRGRLETVTLPLPLDLHEVPRFLGLVYELLLRATATRRARATHHTEIDVAREVAERALAPLLTRDGASVPVVCDPAAGSGVFLAEALRVLRRRFGIDAIVREGLRAVDVDPRAVLLAKTALFALSSRTDLDVEALDRRFVCGDFVEAAESLGAVDAFVGNPPWIAYKGRAAEPITPTRTAFLRGRFEGFRGYPTLHGVFVEACARGLAPGGRLGLVVPTSMADLDGYAPARRAHDRHAEPDRALPDFGADAFDGVFQPAMALLSTRRAPTGGGAGDSPSGDSKDHDHWDLARDDLDEETLQLLARLRVRATLPVALFGERGLQTTADDRPHLSKVPQGERRVPLLTGSEIRPFRALAPTLFIDPREFGGRLRAPEEWAKVAVWIRQTARFPIAAPSSGLAFRNSVLAGFTSREISAPALVAYLNSNVVRFIHYQRFRDARQGMPQLKIGHLRALPLPDGPERVFAALAGFSSEEETDALDAVVAESLGLSTRERELVKAWASSLGRVPSPRARR
jgi:hypothetical protein